MKVSAKFLSFLLCHQIFLEPLVEAKLKVTILNVYINKTSSKYVNVVKFNVSPDSLLTIETDLLQDLTSVYVKILLIIEFFYLVNYLNFYRSILKHFQIQKE